MPGNYTLDTAIEALNLLDLHDGDFQLVKSRLNIPIKTLVSWHMEEDKLRLIYETIQWQRIADMKRQLCKDLWDATFITMEQIKSGNYHGSTPSQLTYSLSTLLNQALRMEKSLLRTKPNPKAATKQLKQITYVYNDRPQAAPPWTVKKPEEHKPLQSSSQWQAPGEIEIGSVRHLESGTPETPTLPAGSRLQSDDQPDPARSGKPRQRRKTWRRQRPKRWRP